MIEVAIEDLQVQIPTGQMRPGDLEPPIIYPLWIVVLKSKEDERSICIWIGQAEGEALGMQLAGLEMPRPPTYTFMASLLESVAAKLDRVTITELSGDAFIATATIRYGRKTAEVDARPSDALNLAIRTEAPIFVAEAVFEKAERGREAFTQAMADLSEDKPYELRRGVEVVQEKLRESEERMKAFMEARAQRERESS